MINIISKIFTSVLTALYQSFWFSMLFSVFFMFFWLYSHEKMGGDHSIGGKSSGEGDCQKGYMQAAKDWLHYFKTSSIFRRTWLLVFYTTMILFRTLLNRNMWMNPLSDLMGGWWIYEDGELTTECIENLMLFVPFTVLLLWAVNANETMRTRLFKDMKIGRVLRVATKSTFLFCTSIEFLQLFLRLGTWQFSDIFYNTLGGFLGGLIYWIGWRIKMRADAYSPAEL